MMDMNPNMPMVGDRVRVVINPHVEGHDQGTVRQSIGGLLGIEFDSAPGFVHHWYAPTEVAVTEKKMAMNAEDGSEDDMEMRRPTGQAGSTSVSIDTSPISGMNVPHIDQYLGVWAVEPSRFLSLAQMAKGLDLRSHVIRQQEPERQAAFEDGARRDYPITDGIAVINVYGPLMKFVGSMEEGSSTIALRRQIRNAANDPAVSGILLRIDSPGGTVAGTEDLAADVAAAAKRKPVHAYVEDLCASAAYWVASQALNITANATAIVGSIGTFCVVHDMSEMAKTLGIKVHVVRAGDFKGAGVPGTEVTNDQLAEWQRMVDTLNSHFLNGVATGRHIGIAAARDLNDGRVWIGKEAISKSLIDGVGSFDQAVADLRKAVKSNSQPKERSDMPEPTPTAATATYNDIVAACPGISQKDDSQFIVDQLAKGSTAQAAGAEWVRTLKARVEMREQEIAARDTELAELKAKAATPAPAPAVKQGVKPIPTTSAASTESTSTSAAERFNEAVQREVEAGVPRHQAHANVCRKQPTLRAAMVEEANASRRTA